MTFNTFLSQVNQQDTANLRATVVGCKYNIQHCMKITRIIIRDNSKTIFANNNARKLCYFAFVFTIAT